VHDTTTKWIEAFQAKRWYPLVLPVVMLWVAIDVWIDRGAVLGAVAVLVFAAFVGLQWIDLPRFTALPVVLACPALMLAGLFSWPLWVCAALSVALLVVPIAVHGVASRR
jgi:hypothetical protein